MTTDMIVDITAGDGPKECRLAVKLTAERFAAEAVVKGISCDIKPSQGSGLPPSVQIKLCGARLVVEAFVLGWLGTVRWQFQSPYRPQHKRKNWFVGVALFQTDSVGVIDAVSEADVRIETFRAGGPGGQHQNKTDSAVRVTHTPTGIVATCREHRSQHRNRAQALTLLHAKLKSEADADSQAALALANKRHHSLERGKAVREFRWKG